MVKSSKSSEVKQTTQTTSAASLNRWNRWLTGLYVVQSLVIALLATAQAFPVQTSYLTSDPIASDVSGGSVVGVATAHLLDINLMHLVVAFLLVAAIAHALVATVYRSQYEADLKKRLNKLRWIEYAVSGGVALVAVALLGGIADIATLLVIFVLTVITALAGLAMETYNQGKAKPNWLAYVIGGIAGVLPGVIFAIYAWSTHNYGGFSMPGYVYGIYATLFVLGLGFAANMILQYKQVGKWKDYLYAEHAYMILSIVAKTALAWQIFAGALRP
jgi:hypothetical protein